MLKMEDFIREPKNAKEVKNHLKDNKLCMQQLADATVVMYKDGNTIKVLIAQSDGNVTSKIGGFEHSMNMLATKKDTLGLPTLLNMNKSEAENILETLVLYETQFRK